MDGRPTVRQVYALAAALCERAGESFPETFEEASELIERLRLELGHPAPRLADVLVRPRWRRGRMRRVQPRYRPPRESDRRASEVAAELAREMR
jgi:transposase